MFFRRKKKSMERPVIDQEQHPEIKAALNVLEDRIRETRTVKTKAVQVRAAAEQLAAPEK